jgi:uncharacterized membrane protein
MLSRNVLLPGLALAAVLFALTYRHVLAVFHVEAYHWKGFDLALWTAQSPILKIHVLAAVSALIVGLVLFSLKKGRAVHKMLGWSWVILMGVTAGASLFITGLNGKFYSPIHALTAFTLVMLPLGIAAIKRKDVVQHRRRMTGIFIGGLIIAGAFTFVPGRLMWNLFFGA